MKTRTLLTILVVSFLAIFVVGSVLASGQAYSYNVTVPKFGGSTSTNNVSKVSSENAYEHSTGIGGGYSLLIRLENVSNSSRSSWYRIYSSTTLYYPTSASQWETVHMRLKTDVLTYVNVQASGSWSPDSP